MKLFRISILILSLLQIYTYSYAEQGFTVNKKENFGVWTVSLLESDNSLKIVTMDTQCTPYSSIFQIAFYKGNRGKLSYRLISPNPMNLPNGRIETGQCFIQIGNYNKLINFISKVDGPGIMFEYDMPSNFINLAKNNNFFTILYQLPNIPPLNISLIGFSEAFKYANNIFKNIK